MFDLGCKKDEIGFVYVGGYTLNDYGWNKDWYGIPIKTDKDLSYLELPDNTELGKRFYGVLIDEEQTHIAFANRYFGEGVKLIADYDIHRKPDQLCKKIDKSKVLLSRDYGDRLYSVLLASDFEHGLYGVSDEVFVDYLLCFVNGYGLNVEEDMLVLCKGERKEQS